MRFGDLFGRKPQGAASGGGSTIMHSRAHHYQFAHNILPSLTRRQPGMYIRNFAGERGQEMITFLWNWLGERMPAEERLPPDGLRVEVRVHAPYAIALFTLPTPQAMTEAYFTALATALPDADENLGSTEDEEETQENSAFQPIRYITLEYGFDIMAGTKHTVLGEWTFDAGETRHLNMGDGPDPDLDAFYNRVCVLLD